MMSTVDPAAKRRAAQLGRRPSAEKAAVVLVGCTGSGWWHSSSVVLSPSSV
ncbi:MAG: hypothetical protein AAGC80_14230 [Rhodococcus sp. (in: high G+C Gram-positive bacteria)]